MPRGRKKDSKDKVNKVVKVKNLPIIEPPPVGDPEWAKTSTVDPKTGMHISQWRQEQLRKQNAV